MARDKARLPLTRPKSTNPPAAVILAFSPIEQKSCQLAAMFDNHDHGPMSARTFVLRLVVERQRLCATLDAQHTSGVTSIGL